MREHLIELLGKAKDEGWRERLQSWESPTAFVADHLLANGVIVPPCKVGDTVYCIDHVWNIVETCKVYGFQIVRDRFQLIVDNGECKFVTSTWYNTREIAECGLKERE
jgi:hypothetical protein